MCIELEINQGYTTMHGQPVIKICTCPVHIFMIFVVSETWGANLTQNRDEQSTTLEPSQCGSLSDSRNKKQKMKFHVYYRHPSNYTNYIHTSHSLHIYTTFLPRLFVVSHAIFREKLKVQQLLSVVHCATDNRNVKAGVFE